MAQAAAKLVLEPIFEVDFVPCSYGFRPKRSATSAMERLRIGFIEGYTFVVSLISPISSARSTTTVYSRGESSVSDRRVLNCCASAAGRGVGGWVTSGRSRARRKAG